MLTLTSMMTMANSCDLDVENRLAKRSELGLVNISSHGPASKNRMLLASLTQFLRNYRPMGQWQTSAPSNASSDASSKSDQQQQQRCLQPAPLCLVPLIKQCISKRENRFLWDSRKLLENVNFWGISQRSRAFNKEMVTMLTQMQGQHIYLNGCNNVWPFFKLQRFITSLSQA